MNLVLSCCFFVCCIWLTECVDRDRNKACYQAKICIHNNNEKCGVNSYGRLRRFLDSCDILEYNCLRLTDYVKTSNERCLKLPPMKNKKLNGQNSTDLSDDEAVNSDISENKEPQSGSDELLKGEEKLPINGSGGVDKEFKGEEEWPMNGSGGVEKELKDKEEWPMNTGSKNQKLIAEIKRPMNNGGKKQKLIGEVKWPIGSYEFNK